MENSFNNSDFEQFVKQNADQYRMFPSEKVWKNINNTLHTRRRWYGIGFVLLLLTTVAVTWVMVSSSGKKQAALIITFPAAAKNTIIAKKTPEVIIAPANRKSVLFTSSGSQEDIISLTESSVSVNKNINELFQLSQDNKESVPLSSKTNQPTDEKSISSSAGKELIALSNTTASINHFTPFSSAAATVNNTIPDVSENNKSGKIKDIYPLSIESVVNSYINVRKHKKLLWQIYVTPVVSYRRLDENKAFLNSVRSNSLNFSNAIYTDINNVVTHKPDMGLQLGFNAAFPVSKKVMLTTGLQLNVSKYDIRAYSYHTEIATIALNSNTVTNSWVSTYSNYRNFGGFAPDWLRNLYISASIPIGAELQLTSSKKGYMGISGNIQPTYVLADKSYLISTDYQHYSEVPSLTRKWNLASGFEIFAGNSTGKVNWRIGPQVRYQMLSSYKEKYPIKEHLFDFGLKFGIMLNK